ncbi:hypothetical protein ACM26V_12910 [Salipaludibacillus sp. HK11]|uniref:hypothetical protein n=1 Tax=Salipaludibacillus sp. HK11 TaxID=3394320 RepID=UPI0039FDA84D
MASGIGREGSQEGAACAPWRAEFEGKCHKRERVVPHAEKNWKERVTTRKAAFSNAPPRNLAAEILNQIKSTLFKWYSMTYYLERRNTI